MVSEISAASNEQTAGVGQVGEAVTQLDQSTQLEQSTQQNAALVEEMAAAASSLSGQAEQMVMAIARFNLGNTGDSGQRTLQSPASGRAGKKRLGG